MIKVLSERKKTLSSRRTLGKRMSRIVRNPIRKPSPLLALAFPDRIHAHAQFYESQDIKSNRKSNSNSNRNTTLSLSKQKQGENALVLIFRASKQRWIFMNREYES